MRLKVNLAVLGGLVVTTLLGGCSLGYYWQASMGHMELMRLRRPVTEVIDDPATTADVRAKLRTATQALDYAHAELGLPDNGSYRLYADTGRPYVVWNVVAAPEFSLEPRTWCFPVAGCISYRGYFAAAGARKFADGLAEKGDDIFVGGVAAYSTLGRFEDPILNTMIGYTDYQLAGLIFHELAHQLVYVKDDSKFNEGFASFVEQQGLRLWLQSLGAADVFCRFVLSEQRLGEVQALLADYRARLATLYDSDRSDDELRAGKEAILGDLIAAYRDARAQWPDPPYFDHWFDGTLNNARLVAFATYDEYVPAFATLLVESGGDLQSFYARAEALAALEAAERTEAMAGLLALRETTAETLPPGCTSR